MNGLAQDFIFALRLLRKRPFASVVIIATLGLGIAINAAFFASFYGMALRPLPFHAPDELVTVYRADPEAGESFRPLSEIDLFHFKDSSALAELSVYDVRLFNLRSEGPAERVQGAAVGVDLFPMLGLEPEQGRAFTVEDGQPGAPRVVLIGDDLWRRTFGGDPSLVGQHIRVDGEPAEVIGIMPAGVQFPMYHDMWSPLQIDRAGATPGPSGLSFIGRLAPGSSVDTAMHELDGITAALRATYPDHYEEGEVTKVRGLRDTWMPPVTQVAAVTMQALASLVLLIVCANVANMVLAQSMLRRQEKAMRVALGASRLRLLRQSMVEAVVLSVLGGGSGLLLVLWQGDWLQEISSVPIPYWLDMGVDGPVVLFALGLTLVTGVGVGLISAFRGGEVIDGLKSGGRSDGGSSAPTGRLRTILVVGEYALAVVVLAGALLMVQAYDRLQSADTGFAIDERATLKLSLGDDVDREEGLAIVGRALETIRQLPEVRSASVTSFLPIENHPYFSAPIEVLGLDFEDRPAPRVTIQAIEPAYLKTLDIDLVAGRGLTQGEYDEGAAKALISQSLAERLWPEQGAVGRQLRVSQGEAPWLEIVGVTRDVEPGEPLVGIDRKPSDQIYVAMSVPGFTAEMGALSQTPAFVIETEASLTALAPKLREVLAVAAPEVPVYDVRTMETVLRQHYFAQHIWSRMFSLIAFVALGIAALGAYGVSAYAVNRRMREMGIRLALGARPQRLMTSVIGRGISHAVLGLGLGLLLALPMARGMSGMLYGVELWNVAVLGSVVGLLATVALMATVFPARRASRVDPVIALRQE